MQGAWVTEKLIRPRPVAPELFSGRIEGVDASTAGSIYKALKKAELLNATDFLKEDPRCAPDALASLKQCVPLQIQLVFMYGHHNPCRGCQSHPSVQVSKTDRQVCVCKIIDIVLMLWQQADFNQVAATAESHPRRGRAELAARDISNI